MSFLVLYVWYSVCFVFLGCVCFNNIAFLRAYRNRITCFLRRLIDTVTHICVFALGSRHLRL